MKNILCIFGFHKWIMNYDWRSAHLFDEFCERCYKERLNGK